MTTKIMCEIIDVLRVEIPDAKVRCSIYKKLIIKFMEEGWCGEQGPLSCNDPAYKAALRLINPNII